MNQANSSKKYNKLWEQLLEKHYIKQKPSLRYFVALHADDSQLLTNLGTQDPDPRGRKTAVEKITENKILTSIAIEDNNPKVQQTAINKITDKKSLLLLRLSLSSELQGHVNQRVKLLDYNLY